MSVHDSVPQHQVRVDLGTGLELLPGVTWSVSRALSGSGLPGQARAVSGSSVATGTLTVVDGRTPWTAQAIAAGGAVRIDAALDAHQPLTRVATMRARSLDAAGARAVDRSLSIEDDLAGLLAPMTVPARIPSAPVDLSTVITDLAAMLGLPADVQSSGVLVPAILPEGRTGWEVCQWVASVTLGACWLSETGVLTYRGPAAMRGQGTPRETIHTLAQVVDLPWSESTDDVADRVTLTYTPITVERVSDQSLTVWESTETLTVAAGATVVVEQDLETAVDALASWRPVWDETLPAECGSRWAASTQPEGGGERPADGALTVSSTLVTASRIRITLTNTTSAPLYVGGGRPTQLLTVRADVRASRGAQVTLAAGVEEALARATLAVDMGTGITDDTSARAMLAWLTAQTASPRATLSRIQVVPDLARRLGDLAEVVDPITGLSSRVIISGIHLAAQAGSLTQALDLVLVDGVAPSPPAIITTVTGEAGTSTSGGISAVEQARRDEAERTDMSPPSVPSAPTLAARLGVLSITWDGLSNTGGAVSSNLGYVEVALGGATAPTTVVDRIERGGGTVHVTGLPYDSLRYVRMRGVSRNGVASAWSAERSQAVTPLVNADLIGQVIAEANLGDNVVTARTILAGSVTTLALDALAVTADKIATNAITADKVLAGAITGTKIAGDAIDGKTITGATLRTAASGQRVQIDASGLRAFNSGGTAVTTISASTGVLTATSASISGAIDATSGTFNGTVNAAGGTFSGTITGGTFVGGTFTTAASGTRVIVGGTGLTFYPQSGSAPSSIHMDAVGNLRIGAPVIVRLAAPESVANGSLTVGTTLNVVGSAVMQSTVQVYGQVSTVGGSHIVSSGGLQSQDHSTTTSAANVRYQSSGWLWEVTSRRDSKVAIEDAPEGWGTAFWDLRPRTWIDRGDAERLADGLTREADGETVDWDQIPVDPLRRIPGFVAEEVAEAGLAGLVTYDDTGQITGLAYDRMLTAAVLAMRGERDRTDTLTQQVADLTARLTALEGAA